MFILNRNEYDEIVGVVSKYCCDCSGAYCSEADCDVQDIFMILDRHMEKENIGEEYEKLPFDI